jgi:hypothetical protein
MLGDRRDAGHQVSRRDVIFMVFAAKVPGGETGVFHFVVPFGVEADRVGGCRLACHLAEHACHGRAIGATRQEGADAFVAGDLFGDAVADQVAEGVARRGERLAVLLVEKQGPVAGFVHTIAVNQHAVCCRQPAHLAENRAWCGDHVEIEVIEDRLRIKFFPSPLNAVGTIGESERLAVAAITEGLDGESVNGQEDALAPRVDDRQSVGAADVRGKVWPRSHARLENFFGRS